MSAQDDYELFRQFEHALLESNEYRDRRIGDTTPFAIHDRWFHYGKQSAGLHGWARGQTTKIVADCWTCVVIMKCGGPIMSEDRGTTVSIVIDLKETYPGAFMNDLIWLKLIYPD